MKTVPQVPIPITRVRTQRSFEQVCAQVRKLVAQGALAPGDRLPHETELALKLKVSRTAVREALRSLELAGIVEMQTGVRGGFFISQGHVQGLTQAVRDMVSLSKVSAAEITEARLQLTRIAIELACERGTEEDLDAIEAEIDAFEKLAKQGAMPTRATPVVTEFYRVLAMATHNRVIVMLVESLSELVRGMLAAIDLAVVPDVVKVRRKVLRHLRSREAQKASDALVKHLHAVTALLEEQRSTPVASAAGTRRVRGRSTP
jgi:GntR family transcriptional repressor for pyruvate dehydrogenase complex